MSDDTNPLPVAIIGITGFGAKHYGILRELEDVGRVRIAAATIINRGEVPDEWNRLEASGARLYTDFREMLEAERGRIEATFIPTGIAWHEPMALAALEAGTHVYLEKPAAATVAEVDAMIAARDAAGKKLTIGFQHFSDPGLRETKERLLAGELGSLESVSVLGLWPRRQSYYQRNAWAGRIVVDGQPVRDSPANNALSHFLILAMYLGSRGPHEVAALSEIEASLLRAKPIESFDTLSLRGLLDGGIALNCQFSHSCRENQPPRIRVRGNRGLLDWAKGGDCLFSTAASSAVEARPAKDIQKEALANFVEAVRSDRSVDCSLEMAREHTRVIERLHADHPIGKVPEKNIESLETEDDRLDYIPAIEALMSECFEDPSGCRIIRAEDLACPSNKAAS